MGSEGEKRRCVTTKQPPPFIVSLLCPRQAGSVLHIFSYLILTTTCEVGTTINPMLQMQKQRHREVRSLAGRQVEEPAGHLIPV